MAWKLLKTVANGICWVRKESLSLMEDMGALHLMVQGFL